MKQVQISDVLFNKLYAYFVDNQIEYHEDIKHEIQDKADRIFARYEYSQNLQKKKSNVITE